MLKNCIYLVQGKSERIQNYFKLKSRKNVDVILLTFDQPIEGAIYFPDSTWAEGRNLLLKKALELEKDYEYYIFLDDDVNFVNGSYKIFEEQLTKLKPAIAVPVFFPKTILSLLAFGISFRNNFFYPLKSYQVCYYADAQFIAFHKDVITDWLVVPLQTQFDKISWWYTSSTQQLLMHNLYQKYTLQFNNVVVENIAHTNYTNSEFKRLQRQWFKQQFRTPIKDPRPYAINLLSLQGIWHFIKKHKYLNGFQVARYVYKTINGTLNYQKKSGYSLPKKKVFHLLRKDSTLLKQYLSQMEIDQGK